MIHGGLLRRGGRSPHARGLAFHETIKDPELVAELLSADLPASLRGIGPVRAGAARAASLFARARYSVSSEDGAETARRKILAGFDRLEAELEGGDYLVGDSFTVADLTAASLLYPVVQPADGPPVAVTAPAFERFREPLKERRGFRYVEEMFTEHRRDSAAATRQAA